uniref:Uncharacterized protein n=2 Tax=viral metagenome TaxID=1070528 RepID=A0A6M3JS30_9ZZZZ
MYYGKTSYLETWGDEEEKPMAHIPEQETYEGELEEIPVNDEEKPESVIVKRGGGRPRKITPTDTVKIGKIPGIDTVVHKGPMIKICRDCQKTLSIDEFQRNNRSKDGHLHICIQCHKERTNIPSPGKADNQLNIPIDDYPWIIARLKASGKLTKNLRTWPQQALVYILQGLEKDGITGEE